MQIKETPFAPARVLGHRDGAEACLRKGDFNTNPANRAPIGTGPYRFKEWKSDQYISLEANADYFEGRPHIQEFVYRIIPDQSVEFLEMRNQSIDEIHDARSIKAYDSIFRYHQRYRQLLLFNMST